jgi:signal transduction histidine kinase
MASAAASPHTEPLDLSDSSAPTVRWALGVGTATQVLLLVAWLVTHEKVLLMGVACSLMWSGINIVMIRLQRESGIVALASGGLLVSLYATYADLSAVHQTASLAVILSGVAAILFLKKHENLFLVVYSGFVLGAHFVWMGWTAVAVAEGLVSAVGFIVGALGLRWIRDRSMDSASRFLNLFERAPVSIWEEDYSRVGEWLDDLRAQGVRDLRTHLIEDPAALREGMARIEVVRVNQAAADFLEVDDPAALVGPLKLETFPDDALPSMADQFEAIWNGVDHLTTEVRRGYTTQGNPLDGLLHFAVPRRFGKPDLSRVIVSVVDVTAMNDVRRDLEASLRSKDELIATVSHELRTPLTTVVGLSSELSDSYDDFDKEEAKDLLRMIAEQSVEVATIVEDLLVAARAESGSLKVATEPVDVHLEAKTTLRGLDAVEEVDCHTVGLVATAYADSGRVRQIIRNLLVNARRYGSSPIRVIVRNQEDFVALEVRDGGEPIPADERTAIFERYYRARQDPGTTASVGLGLSVSRELARIMGGDITYHHDGESVFTLTVPRDIRRGSTVAS